MKTKINNVNKLTRIQKIMLEFITYYITLTSYYIVNDTLKKLLQEKNGETKKVSKMTTIHEIKLEITL